MNERVLNMKMQIKDVNGKWQTLRVTGTFIYF